ncbi:MAG: chain length determinant protein EpsF [Aquabacterium sp.]
MSFEQLAAILRARWVSAAITFVAIMGAVTTYTILAPRSYTAFSTVLVDAKPDPILGAVLNGGGSLAYMMTQVDILSSRRVALRAAKQLNLAKTPQLYAQWQSATGGQGDFDAWAADLIRSGIQAQPSRGSNVITVTYSAADPNFASAMTNAFVQSYLDTTMDLRATPAKQYNSFFDNNAKQLKAQLETAQTKLSEFQRNQELIATDERVDIESTRLSELSTQLVGLEAMAAESINRQKAANAQGDKAPDVMSSPLVMSLKSDLVKNETQLEQLSTRLGSQHPTVVELQASVADTRRKLDAEIKRVTSSVGVGNTVTLARVAATRSELEAQRAKVLQLKSVHDQAALLQQEVVNAQRAYEGVVTRLNTASLESQAVPVSVSVLEYATPPITPSSPRIKQTIGFGFVIALMLAVGMALLIEQFDRRLRTNREAESLLSEPVIAIIPSFKKATASIAVPRRLQLHPPTVLKALSE